MIDYKSFEKKYLRKHPRKTKQDAYNKYLGALHYLYTEYDDNDPRRPSELLPPVNMRLNNYNMPRYTPY